MSDLLILIGVVIVSSFVATFGIARRLARPEPLTEVERLRIELDALLDQLDPSELQDVARFSRELCARRTDEENANLERSAATAHS